MKINVHRSRSLSGRTDQVAFNLDDLRWYRHGPATARAFGDAERDLCEVARVIHEVERLLPKRIIGDRVDHFVVSMSLRDPSRWEGSPTKQLAELLRIQGNARWEFDFTARRKGERTRLDEVNAATGAKETRQASALSLFSGGLDSTSGLAGYQDEKKDLIVMSYFTGNLHKQQKLLADLGFDRHVQVQGRWQHPKGVRSGGSFNYRSLLFLSLAAAEASANNVDRILQFENGPLALAVAPAPIYRVTRHAHPRVQQLASDLFSNILERENMRVENPFVKQTKREVVQFLRNWAHTDERFRQVVNETETCWYLKSTMISGTVKKKTTEACGICIPCLVRKAALPYDDTPTAIDLTDRKDANFNNDVVRTNVESYLDMAERMLGDDYGIEPFFAELPRVTAAFLAGKNDVLSVQDAYDLFRRFAKELVETFPRP
ncbi:7-cyano-7-deazaguanine synthase [Mesorhizobium mediterraneum]|uniref:7-cyano-7-deazaguanine synthase n=1 Tax=Mesorhizobium mediterraneum TaxID=43617 RepID=UPI001782C15D|nr:7-cyano-7-deazaguanine synthase [Mesorhizobium mediterraneum]